MTCVHGGAGYQWFAHVHQVIPNPQNLSRTLLKKQLQAVGGRVQKGRT